jgi:hypothetical protein
VDCPVTKAVLARQAKAANNAAKKAAKIAACQQARAANLAVFQSLQPFGVEARNLSMFTPGNWATEGLNLCHRCHKPEPKNGCWCIQVK